MDPRSDRKPAIAVAVMVVGVLVALAIAVASDPTSAALLTVWVIRASERVVHNLAGAVPQPLARG